MTVQSKTAATYQITVYIAGDLDTIRETCRGFCRRGLCVTVEPTDFVYKYGMESGARVGLVNYPRFPADRTEIDKDAYDLAELLMGSANQRSALVVSPLRTTWLYREEEYRDD